MKKEEIINYWIKSSDGDFKTMEHLFDSKDYTWALFMGHLVIEKLAKALHTKMVDGNAPHSHNLVYILSRTGIEFDEKKSDLLSDLTTFNINARYDDYKREFKKTCSREYAGKYINEIKGLRRWLKKLIKIQQ